MSDFQKQISDYIDAHADEMVEDTMTLCRINSVKAPYEEGKPYGDGPYQALMAAQAMCERYGFQTTNYDNYVITADLGKAQRQLDILAHMDVVAPGDGWTVTEPFKPVLKDGMLYGRGTSDDKGPAVTALYAMRAVKELGLPVTKNCRLILGSDEECGSSDIEHYYAVEPEAPMTFSPDAEFPVINVEKGQFRGEIHASFPAPSGEKKLISLEGGTTTNIVPGKANALIQGLSDEEIRAAAQKTAERTGVSFRVSETEKGVCIHAEGQGAHASRPEDGKNAVLALLSLVAELPLTHTEQFEKIKAFVKLFPYGEFYGESLGVNVRDEISGNTTVSLNIVKISETAFYAKFDARTSIAANEENTIMPVKRRVEQEGFQVDTDYNPPHAVPADTPFIHTLLNAYEAVTGKKGRCLAIGGGTYVHHLKNGVAFGAVGETTDTHMHGADECMPIEEMKQAAKIYALAIAELCK